MAERRGRRAAPGRTATEDLPAQIDDSVSCVVVQTPDVFGNLRDLQPSPTKRTGTARSDRGVHRDRCRSASSCRPARWAPTSWSARASRSATRSLSAGPMWACSRRGRNSCGRCRAASAAKPSMRTASAASCSRLDPRAAHPPRQGDLEHLHQFRPVLPRVHDPHDAARRGRPAPARAHQPRQCA